MFTEDFLSSNKNVEKKEVTKDTNRTHKKSNLLLCPLDLGMDSFVFEFNRKGLEV